MVSELGSDARGLAPAPRKQAVASGAVTRKARRKQERVDKSQRVWRLCSTREGRLGS
jgi:hypothetical protein